MTIEWGCPGCWEVVETSDDTEAPSCPECSKIMERTDMSEVVDVVFLRDYGSQDIVAIFPGISAVAGNPNLMTCYAHIGQHGVAAFRYCDECDEVTEREEYADLVAELERIGYVLYVVSKDRMHDSEYAAMRRKQLEDVE